MQIGTRQAVNARLDALKKAFDAHKRELLHAAEEGGMKGISAESMRYASIQLDWAINKIDELKGQKADE